MKLSKKHAPILKAILMAVLLPLIMTFFITLLNAGFRTDFILLWMKNFAIAAVIAFPLILFLSPMIQKLVEKITE